MPFMDESWTFKREWLETEIEPRGKAGRLNIKTLKPDRMPKREKEMFQTKYQDKKQKEKQEEDRFSTTS